MHSVVLIAQHAPEGAPGREVFDARGYFVLDELHDPLALIPTVVRLAPDLVIVCTDWLRDDMLNSLRALSSESPRPVVLFTSDASRDAIRSAVDAGVSAYVVDGWASDRVVPIIEAACARFDAHVSLKHELAAVKNQLAERKLIEKAKGIVMHQRRLSEEQAYGALRKMAMDQNLTLVEISRRVIDVASLLA
jgi:two-component system, response regulator / RNA-binding antiterminator